MTGWQHFLMAWTLTHDDYEWGVGKVFARQKLYKVRFSPRGREHLVRLEDMRLPLEGNQ